MKEFLQSLGIHQEGQLSRQGAYVVDIVDFDEYSKIYSLLERSELIDEVMDTSQITIHTTNVTFANDDYQLVLQADLDEDIYKLVVTES